MSQIKPRPDRLTKPTSARSPRRPEGFPRPVRDLIEARAGGVCELCGVLPVAQIHHRRPRGMGGTSDPGTNRAANGLALCSCCHDVVEGRSVLHPQLGRVRGSRAESERKGWLISRLSPDAPDEVPVWTAIGWVQLSNSGAKRRIEGRRP